jgi:hypothetical protein
LVILLFRCWDLARSQNFWVPFTTCRWPWVDSAPEEKSSTSHPWTTPLKDQQKFRFNMKYQYSIFNFEFWPDSLDKTFLNSLTYSLTHNLTHSPTRQLPISLSHLLTNSQSHSLTCSLTHNLTHSPTRSLTISPTHLLANSQSHSLMLLAYLISLTHLLPYSQSHSLTISLTNLIAYLQFHSLTYSLNPNLTHSQSHSLAILLTRNLTHSPILLLPILLTHLLAYSQSHSLTYSLIHYLTHLHSRLLTSFSFLGFHSSTWLSSVHSSKPLAFTRPPGCHSSTSLHPSI